MKRITIILVNFIIISVFTIFLYFNNIYGAEAILSGGTVETGGQITVKISFSSDVCAAEYSLTYDNSKLELISGEINNAWVEGEAYPNVTFKSKSGVTGNASVSLSGTYSDTNYNPGSISGNTSIVIREKTQTNTNNNTTNNNTTTNTAKPYIATANTSVKNNNAYLSKLQVDQEGLTPNFNKNKTNYTIAIGENISELNITAVPEASTSKVTITGNKDLKAGDNNIIITVTAQDGTKKVYTIVATKTADPVKSNSYLLNLIVENATLSPEFSREIFEYDCGTVGASIENLKILAFGENENVNIEIIGNDRLQDGENTITVKVTSEDGTTTKEYVIKVVKDPSLVEDEEINYLKSENDNDSFLRKVYNLLRSKYGILAMLAIILIEFIYILYLYKKINKNNKSNQPSELNTKKRTGAKIFDKDK